MAGVGRAVENWRRALLWHHWCRGWWSQGAARGSLAMGRVGGDTDGAHHRGSKACYCPPGFPSPCSVSSPLAAIWSHKGPAAEACDCCGPSVGFLRPHRSRSSTAAWKRDMAWKTWVYGCMVTPCFGGWRVLDTPHRLQRLGSIEGGGSRQVLALEWGQSQGRSGYYEIVKVNSLVL